MVAHTGGATGRGVPVLDAPAVCRGGLQGDGAMRLGGACVRVRVRAMGAMPRRRYVGVRVHEAPLVYRCYKDA